MRFANGQPRGVNLSGAGPAQEVLDQVPAARRLAKKRQGAFRRSHRQRTRRGRRRHHLHLHLHHYRRRTLAAAEIGDIAWVNPTAPDRELAHLLRDRVFPALA